MIVRLEPDDVRLDDPDDVGRFSVAVGEGVVDPGALLAARHAGGPAEEADHVWVRVDAVRGLARGRVAEGWDERFDGMVAYARTKGWLDEAGTSIKAHLEPAG